MKNRLALVIIITAAAALSAFLFFKFTKASFGGNPAANAGSPQALLSEAKGLEAKADLVGQKAAYQKLVNDFPNYKEVGAWQKRLDELNLKIIFSPLIASSSQEYQVRPQDTLTKIAKEFNTTVELIKRSNSISSDLISPGRRLKIWTGRFSVLVDKSQNVLILKSNDEIIKTYLVATGANNSTPTGTFKIVNKLINPPWYKTGAVIPSGSPENILGTRWMGFDLAGYGIHGTSDPTSLGRQTTAGCVRMLNYEVEELYILLPVGSEVTIVD